MALKVFKLMTIQENIGLSGAQSRFLLTACSLFHLQQLSPLITLSAGHNTSHPTLELGIYSQSLDIDDGL